MVRARVRAKLHRGHKKHNHTTFFFIPFVQVELDSVQTVTSTSMGRFGTTISYLADLNGDGLRDVAVGAPLEDDRRGAVYIYLGDKQSGVRSAFSQVRLRR